MKIIVCIKQVPDISKIKINPDTGKLIRESVTGSINPDDINAIEEALRLKEECGAKVAALCMGPQQAETAIREALALGADDGILLTDKAFEGADTLITAYILSLAIEKIKEYDLILCGQQTIDGNTAQVGPQLAELLDLPQITNICKLTIKCDGGIKAERIKDDGCELVETSGPALLTTSKELNKPRLPTALGIIKSCSRDVTVWASAEVGFNSENLGFKSSPIKVVRIFDAPAKGTVRMLQGNACEMAEVLSEELFERHLL